jgi:hypothetical protein
MRKGFFDACLDAVSTSPVSSSPVEDRSTAGCALNTESGSEAASAACTSPEGRSKGSMREVAGQLRVADQLSEVSTEGLVSTEGR